jgi:hypothetical protein
MKNTKHMHWNLELKDLHGKDMNSNEKPSLHAESFSLFTFSKNLRERLMGLVFRDLGVRLTFQYLEEMGDQNFLHTHSILY